jgi:hypothetical protein
MHASDEPLILGNTNLKLPEYSKDTMSPDCVTKKTVPCKSIDAAIGKRASEREREREREREKEERERAKEKEKERERERERERGCAAADNKKSFFFVADCKDKALPCKSFDVC